MKSPIFVPYITPGTLSSVLNGNSAFLLEAQNSITSDSIKVLKPHLLQTSLEQWEYNQLTVMG